jgi:hypothetical protein
MFALSAMVGFAVGAMLSSISREISELLEIESCALAPPARAKAAEKA